MFIDRPNVVENSVIVNATIPAGTSDPLNPSVGELFFRTDLGALRVYSGAAWAEAGKTALDTHVASTSLHLTAAQNTLLDGLAAGLTATELNYVDGVTSPIQSQLDAIAGVNTTQNTRLTALETTTVPAVQTNLSTHIADASVHLTSAQNTFIDALNLPTLTAAHVNFLTGVTSNVQTQLNTATTNLSTHIADASVHLTSYQNTLLDTLQFEGVSGADLAKMIGAGSGLAGSVADNINNMLSDKLSRTGSIAMTGTLNMGNNRITGILVDGSSGATDAVSKAYVDNLQQGLSWKQAVRVASTGNLVLSGLQTIDGVAVVASDRVLVKNQSSGAQNGIYLAASGAWSRALDANSAAELNGASVFVTDGTTHGDTAWVQTQTVTALGTTPVVFSQFSAAGGASAGQGILIAGSTISVRNGNGLTFSGSDLTLNFTPQFVFSGSQLDLTDTVPAGTYRSVTVNSKGRITGGTNPTTLAGYGITDAQFGDADLTAIASFTGTGIAVRTGASTWAQRSIAVSGVGLTIADAAGVGGNPTISSNATASNVNSTVVARDGSGNFAANVITVSTVTASGTISTTTAGSTAATRLYLNSPAGQTADPVRVLVNTVDVFRVTAAGAVIASGGITASGNVTAPSFIGSLTGTASNSSQLGGIAATEFFQYGGFALNANTMGTRRDGYTAALNAPFTGPIVRVGEINYSLQFNAPSVGGNSLAFRTRNGDTSSFNSWRRVLTEADFTTWAPSLTGAGASGTWGISITGNAASATVLQTARTINGVSFNGSANITITAASANAVTFNSGGAGAASGSSYTGSAALTVSHNTIGAPSLTGTGASGTWGISITGNANTVGGFGASASQVVSTIPVRDASGHTYFGYINSNTGNAENPTVSQVIVTNGTDNFYRKASVAHLTSALSGTAPINITGRGYPRRSDGGDLNFFWSGQSGQPTWLWGGTDGTNMYVYNPSNFVVANTTSISSAVGDTYTWTGAQQFRSNATVGSSTAVPLQAFATSSGAIMNFHRSGSYAINMGLDTDNVFRLGGWSDGTNIYRFSVSAAGDFTARGNVTAYSDRRLKTDIEPIHNALDKVQRLEGVSYKRIDTGDYQVGLIAQDVEKVVSEAVKEQDGYKTVAYGNLVAVLVEAIKELRAEVIALKKAQE